MLKVGDVAYMPLSAQCYSATHSLSPKAEPAILSLASGMGSVPSPLSKAGNINIDPVTEGVN